jgi:hypothetical protein
VGWVGRGVLAAKKERLLQSEAPYRRSGEPELAREQNRPPFVVQTSEDESLKPAKVDGKKPTVSSKVPAPTNSKPISELPVPSLAGQLPPPTETVLQPQAVASPTPPGMTLHAAEAKVREIAGRFGGSVISVRDAKGLEDAMARTLGISVSPQRAEAMSREIKSRLGGSAMVEPPKASSASEAGSSDLTSAQTALDSIKQKLHQAELDFYPDAPALKSLRGQYADQLKLVEGLRRSLDLPVVVTVVLTSAAG